jgi:hypothetical protein
MEKYDTFISYRRADHYAAEAMEQLLSAHGHRVFRDTVEIGAGERWKAAIDSAAKQAPRLLVLWSRNAFNSSEVIREIELIVAAANEKHEDARIIPMRLDGAALPAVLKPYNAIALDRVAAFSARVEELMKAGSSRRAALTEVAREQRADGSPLQFVEWVELMMLVDAVTDLEALVAQWARTLGAIVSPLVPDPQAVAKLVEYLIDPARVTTQELIKLVGDLTALGSGILTQTVEVLSTVFGVPKSVLGGVGSLNPAVAQVAVAVTAGLTDALGAFGAAMKNARGNFEKPLTTVPAAEPEVVSAENPVSQAAATHAPQAPSAMEEAGKRLQEGVTSVAKAFGFWR